MKSHIEDAKEDFINKGMEKHEAEKKAVKAMGNPEEIGKELNKVHRQKLDWKLLILIFILIGFDNIKRKPIYIYIFCRKNGNCSIINISFYNFVNFG